MNGRRRHTADAELRMDQVQHGLGDVLVSAGTHTVVVTHVEIDAAGRIQPFALAVEHAVGSGDDPLRMNQRATAKCDRARVNTRTALDSDLDEDEHNTRIYRSFASTNDLPAKDTPQVVAYFLHRCSLSIARLCS